MIQDLKTHLEKNGIKPHKIFNYSIYLKSFRVERKKTGYFRFVRLPRVD